MHGATRLGTKYHTNTFMTLYTITENIHKTTCRTVLYYIILYAVVRMLGECLNAQSNAFTLGTNNMRMRYNIYSTFFFFIEFSYEIYFTIFTEK